MDDYKQIDDEIAKKLNKIGCRLYTLKNCLNFYVYCIEQNIYADSEVELLSFGTMLYEFFDITKTKYNNLETELRI